MEQTYELAGGGWVKIDWEKDVQSVQPHYESTLIVLTNGVKYLLRGRRYGV